LRRLTLILPAVALLLTGCAAGSVQVPLPSPDAATARLCAGLRLPQRLQGHSLRATAPASPLVRAWGSPAIALRCGVGRPASLLPTSELVTVSGIPWFAQPEDRPVTFTALGRRAYVEVTVPPAYTENSPPGDVLLDLTGAIKAAIPEKADGEL
jgi:hypothetical protein